MKLKKDVNLIDFLKEVQKCRCDVYLETAFDIAEDMNASLRYGFLSDFGERDIDSEAVSWLRKLHINVIQYYDWSYRHDDLVSKEQQYTDMMGKKISMDTVRKKIREAGSQLP